MSHYAAGRRFEWACRDDLADNGYIVIRAAGSKGDAKVDLIAIKPGQLLFIQCKSTAGALGPAEWDRLVEVSAMVGAIPVLAAKGGRGQGIQYTRLLGPKKPRARVQDVKPFLLDEVGAAA
ncbi:putative holliday junction resolvase [Actinoplanes missouriensis 431]|uniref:Putative holliday junction resolvase n=1 Tax=Actinoplanes missouriensis (strain ATCC 14538 / DSM 43046 / CBS 188.64 / JCM 3121 / NBRC 102363 / NCIMB 12654 / NRRL B-3342 / UNCC 431) TaxID=512565 RepID=I0H2W6_ACTM4|nr:restriction endonuclease [Actinoplanes missouriensis]BAL87353.1 putative holliday junction resolvase [Actinoplanes missouriensis 431]